MLSRMNTGSSSEVSLLPTGLGNHYTSSSKHLIPHQRRKLPYNHSVSSASKWPWDDYNNPRNEITSFREEHDYFGPDVLVIIGIVMACVGGLLTLVSFYCEFKHPAIQATMAGIGPSLIGIGLLFCILRLFFCTYCIRKTCCEYIGDAVRYTVTRCPCFNFMKKTKKQVHPLRVKDINANTPVVNGKAVAAAKSLNSTVEKRKNGIGPHKNGINSNKKLPNGQSIEMASFKMDPIHETEERKTLTPEITDLKDETESPKKDKAHDDDDILNDEIDLLDEIKSEETSPQSTRSLHNDINELVLKTSPRY